MSIAKEIIQKARRRITGDHDDMVGTQWRIDREKPKQLTPDEIEEGMSL